MAWDDIKVENGGTTAFGRVSATEWNNMVTFIKSVISASNVITATVADTGNSVVATITQNDTTNNPAAVSVTNTGTGNGIFIDQNGNGSALSIDTETTNQSGILVVADALTTGLGLNVYSNSAAFTNSNGLGRFWVDNASASGNALKVQNDGTGQAILVDQNGVTTNSDFSAAVTIDNTGNTSSGFLAYSNEGASNKPLASVFADNALFDQPALRVRQDGTGYGIELTTAPIVFTGNRLFTGSETGITANSADLLHQAFDNMYFAIDVGNNSSGRAFFWVKDDDIGGTTTTLMSLNETGTLTLTPPTAATGLFIDQNENSRAIEIDSEATTGAALYANMNAGSQIIQLGDADSSDGSNYFYRNLAAASTAGPVVYINQTNASDDQRALTVSQDGTGTGIFIDNNNTGYAIEIDHDSSSASDIFAIKITNDNAGAGNPGGIDMSSFSVDEPLLKVPADAISSLGTLSGQIAIDVGGTTYYIPYYTTGS